MDTTAQRPRQAWGSCFCLSSAHPPNATHPRGQEDGGQRAVEGGLRQELEGLRLKELRRRAREAGVDADELDEAIDADDPKAAVIALLMAYDDASASEADSDAALRQEFESLRSKDLRKRAREAGVDDDALEDATDADDPKAAVIQLLLAREQVALAEPSRDRPHFGSGTTKQPRRTTSTSAHAGEMMSLPPPDVSYRIEYISEDSVTAGLQQELQGLRLKELRKRAREAGIDADELEDARDADDPKAAVIELLMSHVETSAPEVDNDTALRQELEGLRLKELRTRAREAGVDADELEEAIDADDPKAAVIALLMAYDEASAPVSGNDAALRQELEGLRLKELRRRAREAGIDADELEDAIDADDPKAAVIELLMSHVETSAPEVDNDTALRQELEGLRLKELRKRAIENGLDADELEEAIDADDPKAAVIQLLLAHEQVAQSRPPRDRSHFGSGRKESPAKRRNTSAPRKGFLPTNKHAMVSYQWDDQERVIATRETLTRLGVPCWMDIDGGMQQDIYESMAAGVENAACVVCFLSQKYQESENCKLECKFAKQSGVPIVPVMVESTRGWRPSGWLGIVVAGALWTSLRDESEMESGIRSLVGQIKGAVAGSGGGFSDHEEGDDEEPDDGPGVDTGMEVRAELERLRAQLAVYDAAGSGGSTAILADPSQPAMIPAGVPKLPEKFQTTQQIGELTQLVLSASEADLAMPRVGFWGMGGIGKTVTGAAIVRDDAVRLHFHAIVWVPLGQTPVMSKLQNLCHMQCTGKELSPELSSEEKKEALLQAMLGKRVLLCLDDLWEAEHEHELNFVDVSAGSKVLISTRIKALLEGGHEVEVGLPSLSDSAQMLLRAAGADIGTRTHPSGVDEIVDLCGRLPLALRIAGRLAASLGLVGSQDWTDMIGVLKEELRESHSGGAEEGMIRASLRGLKGSATEQANVRSLLLLFAMVPEDTHCPLDVLLLMFNATTAAAGSGGGGGGAVTIMHIRKWLRILINRSLVLGTIDRPSVHDLVLDFVLAQQSSSELRGKHRTVVNAFRAARPADARGRPMFTTALPEDPICLYVVSEVEHHLRNGAPTGDDVALVWTEWLGDMPQDEITIFAGKVLGMDRLTTMAQTAEGSSDFWLAGRYWSIASAVALKTGSSASMKAPLTKSIDCIARHVQVLKTRHTGVGEADEVYDLYLDRLGVFGTLLDIPGMQARAVEIEGVLASPAATRNPLRASLLALISMCMPAMLAGDVRKMGKGFQQNQKLCQVAMLSDPDPLMRYLCSQHAFGVQLMLDAVLLSAGPDKFDWDQLFGPHAEWLLASIQSYNFDRVHQELRDRVNHDGVMVVPTLFVPLSLHYGDMAAVNEYTDLSLEAMKQAMEQPNQHAEAFGILWGIPAWCFLHELTGMVTTEQQRVTVGLLTSYRLTWATADDTIDGPCRDCNNLRPRGDKSLDVYLMAAEFISWNCKCGHLLMTKSLGVTKAEVISSLPSVKEVIGWAVTWSMGSCMHSCHGPMLNLFIYLAMVCERFDQHEKVLEYTTAAMEPDLEKAGCETPMVRVISLTIQGRAHAALGQHSKAAQGFETAAKEAHQHGLWLLEAYALCDLKLLVLDKMGHGEHGSRRLGAVLRLLTGPAETLTPLLKGPGLDAGELMSLAAPEVGFSVAYIEEDAEVVALRQELQGLRVSGLQRRAVAAGVDDAQLEAAVDSEEPKEQLIALIMEHEEARADGEDAEVAALRQELQGLRVSGLQRRAVAAGVDDAQLEAAV
eukprot:SAG31_NODE_1338_length_8731_cov_14.189643_1_plen_1748_part_10